MMEIIKNLSDYKFMISVLLLLLFSISNKCYSQNCCNSISCTATTDAVLDPDALCLVYPSLGNALVTRVVDDYVWTEGGTAKRFTITKTSENQKNSGCRRLYICPTPFTAPRIDRKRPARLVYLAKYYFYNTRTNSVFGVNGTGGANGYRTPPTQDGRELEKRGTTNNWFVWATFDGADSGKIESFNRQQSGTHAHIYSTPPACEPSFVLGWTGTNMNVIPTPGLAAVGVVADPLRSVMIPPAANGNLDMIVNVAGGGTILLNAYEVNSTTGVMTLIGNANCNDGIRSTIPFNITPGNFIIVFPDPSMYTPTSGGGFTNNFLGGTMGTWRPSISRPRFPDNICLFGTEAPVVGVDVDAAGVIQFRP